MSTLDIYKCPVCSKPLRKENKTYLCSNKHSYDISKDGYVNLLLANQMKSKDPGDSKEMMTARHSFLDKGYFKELSDGINSSVMKHIAAGSGEYTVFDAGCGEGYYTARLYGALKSSVEAQVFGMDISKEAVKLAAKRNREISFCVGSIFHLPILSNSVDCIINIFAPFKEDEFARALRDNGIVIKVTPGAKHLFGLKEALYDNPYLNEEEALDVTSLELTETIALKYDMRIENPQDIVNLLKMTPYYWNTNISKVQEFIQKASRLDTTLDFIITIYKNNKS